MQILALLLVALVFVAVVVGFIALAVFALIMLAFAVTFGLPLFFLGRHWAHKKGFTQPRQSAMERLKTLYIEGKIDMFEFERRAAALLAVES